MGTTVKVAKIFAIISLVLGAVGAGAFLIIGLVGAFGIGASAGAGYGIASFISSFIWCAICCVPILMSIFCIKAIDKANCKQDVLVWGILSIFFVNIITGILLLVAEDKDFAGGSSYKPSNKDYKDFPSDRTSKFSSDRNDSSIVNTNKFASANQEVEKTEVNNETEEAENVEVVSESSTESSSSDTTEN